MSVSLSAAKAQALAVTCGDAVMNCRCLLGSATILGEKEKGVEKEGEEEKKGEGSSASAPEERSFRRCPDSWNRSFSSTSPNNLIAAKRSKDAKQRKPRPHFLDSW